MSNYTKSTNFAIKDDLVTTDPAKIIKGTEIDNEYNAISNAIASKADVNSPSLTGTPTVPTATAFTNTTQIASCAFVMTNGIPSGCIVMWSGTIATIPSGWYLCNGSNSTPDLRNKFIIGAHSDTTGIAYTTITGANTKSGGTKDAVIVSHTHTATVTDPGHFHDMGLYNNGSITALGTDLGNASFPSLGSAAGTGSKTTGISVSIASATSGVSGTNQNLPPYYALAFIMKA